MNADILDTIGATARQAFRDVLDEREDTIGVERRLDDLERRLNAISERLDKVADRVVGP